MSLSGQDSLLVYTYENILYHFVINASSTAVTLVQVGQIALNGIVRAPARVRAVCWILPDHQLREFLVFPQIAGTDALQWMATLPKM
jgi:RAB6A-GEF complex partner protein 1